MNIAVTSDTATTPQLYDVADSILAQKISQIPGVGQVNVGGSSRPALRAELNPLLLSKLGLGLDQVRAALGAANADRAQGRAFRRCKRMFMLNDNDQLFLAKEYAPLIIAYRNGAPVRLSDVATVVDSQENIRNAGFVNGKPAVIVQLYRQPASEHHRALPTVWSPYAAAAGFDSAFDASGCNRGPDDDDPGLGQRC